MTAVTHEIQLDMLALLGAVITHAPAVVAAVLILVATRIAAVWFVRSANAVGSRSLRSASLRLLLEKTTLVGIWTLGVVLAALIAFPGLRLGDIFATLGLTSVAIGFAFQDIFKNFLAGVLLLLNEPFRIGDQIIVDRFEGTVEHIDLRFTSIRTYLGERILVPNATVFTTAVQIRTAFAPRRTDLAVGLVYGSDVSLALSVLRGALDGVAGVEAQPEPRVDAVAFGESSIDFMVRFWSKPHQAEVLQTKSRVIVAIDRALAAASLEIAFPTRTIVLQQPLTT